MTEKNINPLGAALEAASIAGGIVAGLGLATGSIAVAGVALVGVGVYFLAKSKKINPTLKAHGLTPEGQAFSCGVKTKVPLLTKSKTNN